MNRPPVADQPIVPGQVWEAARGHFTGDKVRIWRYSGGPKAICRRLIIDGRKASGAQERAAIGVDELRRDYVLVTEAPPPPRRRAAPQPQPAQEEPEVPTPNGTARPAPAPQAEAEPAARLERWQVRYRLLEQVMTVSTPDYLSAASEVEQAVPGCKIVSITLLED